MAGSASEGLKVEYFVRPRTQPTLLTILDAFARSLFGLALKFEPPEEVYSNVLLDSPALE